MGILNDKHRKREKIKRMPSEVKEVKSAEGCESSSQMYNKILLPKGEKKGTTRYKQNLDNSECFLCSQFGEVKEPRKTSIVQSC